jgi:hypothetical protein
VVVSRPRLEHFSGDGFRNWLIWQWDLPQGNPVRLGLPVTDGTAALRGVAISPDGTTVTAPILNGVKGTKLAGGVPAKRPAG